MQREMRRSDRQLAIEEAKEILTKAEYGSLATIGEDGYPYVVPVSYAFEDSSIYIHGATEGHKLDNINFLQKFHFA
jgi:Predicted flavin-nucleotide-binding protein